ncbi:hypothetical protein NL676_014410 [Syzygium grande]|nr:hypothetical protein NL676_014410 [Syzygium grande]
MSTLRTLRILIPPVPSPPPPPPSFSPSPSRSPRALSLPSSRSGLATLFVAPRRSRAQGPGPNREPAMSDSNSSVAAGLDCNGAAQSVPIGADYAEIVVVRHGETEWNADGRIQGHLDVELNEIGRQQATAVGERLSREGKISAIYSSDLKRAFETANSDCNCLWWTRGYQGSSVCPEAYKALQSQKTDQEIPGGGESIDQVYQRCTTCLRNISMKHKGERVVVVTHGGVIQSLYRRACPNKQPGGKFLNTSVNIFHLSDGELVMRYGKTKISGENREVAYIDSSNDRHYLS